MANITEDEIQNIVTSTLPVGNGDTQITQDHLYKLERCHSTKATTSNELDAVLIEFQDNTDPSNEAITFKPKNRDTIEQLETALRNALPDEYTLIDRDLQQATRLLYEIRAPQTGTAEWLKD